MALRASALVLLSSIAGPAVAAIEDGPPPPPWPVQLRQDMGRLSNVVWRLRLAAGETCPRSSGQTGITIDHIGAYNPGDRAALQILFAMGESPQIAAVAQGSPAAQAGLQVGDLLLAIDGRPAAQVVAEAPDSALVSQEVERALERPAGSDALTLLIERAGKVAEYKVVPWFVCAAVFVIRTDMGIEAYSGDGQVAISTGVIRFARTDDELALVVGHELAHVIARDDRAKSVSSRRHMEDRADLVGAALLTCAGYDEAKAIEYRLRYDRGDWLRWFRAPTHRNPQERVRRVLASQGSTACPIDATNVAALSYAANAVRPSTLR